MIVKRYPLREEKCSFGFILAVVGMIAAVAAVTALVVKFLVLNGKDKYCDCYHCDCEDDDFDEDEDDDFADEDGEEKKDESAPEN